MTDTHIKIGDVSPRIQYDADGATTEFPFPFPVFSDANLAVYVGADKQTAGYAVTGAGASEGGAAVFAAAPAAGALVTLVRETVIERISDFQQAGGFFAATVNTEFDIGIAIAQELADGLTRAMRLPPSAPAASVELPAAAAGRAIKWSAAADALVNSDTDPDTTVALAAAAAADAATALARADEALAAAVQIGLAAIEAASYTLEADHQDYLLPVAVPDAKNLMVFLGGNRQLPGTDYTLTDLLGDGQTLHLVEAVSATPTGLEWRAGLALDVVAIAGGFTTNALNAKSVTEPKLADGAVSTRALADGAVTEDKIGAGAVALAKIKDEGDHGQLLVRGPGGALGHLAVGAGGTVLVHPGAGMLPIWVKARRETPVLTVDVPYDTDTIDIEGGPWTAYDHLRIDLAGLQPIAASNGLLARVKIGGLWAGSSGDYAYGRHELRWPASDYPQEDLSHYEMVLLGLTNWSNVDRAALFGSITVRKADGGFLLTTDLTYGDANGSGWGKCRVRGAGWLRDREGQTTEGLRLYLNSAGFTPLGRPAGTVTVYAIEG